MITQIYHKQNELFEVEFFKDEKCHQMITDWSKYPQIYVELKDGCMSPVNALCDNNIYRDTEYYIPYISHRYTLCKFRLIKTLDDITPNLSKYIPEDNWVLFGLDKLNYENNEQDQYDYCDMFPIEKRTTLSHFFKFLRYKDDGFEREFYKTLNKATIFLPHITQETIKKANEVVKELQEKYGVEEVNVFALHSFINLENWVILEQLSDFGRNILDKMSLNEDRKETPQFNGMRYINKIITTNSTGILEPQNSDRLQVIDCFDIFQEHLKENN